LTDEGKQIADHGSHEAAVFNNIPSEGIALDELMVRKWTIVIIFGSIVYRLAQK